MAIVVSKANQIAYAFLSDSFKSLGKLSFLRKGSPLPAGETLKFNADETNVFRAKRAIGETDLMTWFEGPRGISLDEEVIGLGRYGYTLTALTSEALPEDPDEEPDEDSELERSWTPRFAYGR